MRNDALIYRIMQQYEQRKEKLIAKNLSSEAYQEKLKNLAKELGV